MQYPYLEIFLDEFLADAAFEEAGFEPFDEPEDESLVAGFHFDVNAVDGNFDAEKVAHYPGGFFVADGAGPFAAFKPYGGFAGGDQRVVVGTGPGYYRRVEDIIHEKPFSL